MILESIKLIDEGMKLLDLGTGIGYFAFAIAEKNPHVHVTGLDIVEEALKENIKRAEEKDISFSRYRNDI